MYRPICAGGKRWKVGHVERADQTGKADGMSHPYPQTMEIYSKTRTILSLWVALMFTEIIDGLVIVGSTDARRGTNDS